MSSATTGHPDAVVAQQSTDGDLPQPADAAAVSVTTDGDLPQSANAAESSATTGQPDAVAQPTDGDLPQSADAVEYSVTTGQADAVAQQSADAVESSVATDARVDRATAGEPPQTPPEADGCPSPKRQRTGRDEEIIVEDSHPDATDDL